jgi:hypothetical protein
MKEDWRSRITTEVRQQIAQAAGNHILKAKAEAENFAARDAGIARTIPIGAGLERIPESSYREYIRQLAH